MTVPGNASGNASGNVPGNVPGSEPAGRETRLTHVDARGQARMVDVSGKAVTALPETSTIRA